MEEVIENYKEERFHVAGAGELIISNFIHCSTGNRENGGAIGFHFGVSWGRHGEAGGVLGRREARRLATHILDMLANETTGEEAELIEKEAEYKKFKEQYVAPHGEPQTEIIKTQNNMNTKSKLCSIKLKHTIMKNVSQSAVVFFIGAALIIPGLIGLQTKWGPWVLGIGIAIFVGAVIMVAAGKGRKNI